MRKLYQTNCTVKQVTTVALRLDLLLQLVRVQFWVTGTI